MAITTEGQRFRLRRSMLRRGASVRLGAAVGSGQTRRFQTNAVVKRAEGTKRKKGRDSKLSYQLPVGVEDGAAVPRSTTQKSSASWQTA